MRNFFCLFDENRSIIILTLDDFNYYRYNKGVPVNNFVVSAELQTG